MLILGVALAGCGNNNTEKPVDPYSKSYQQYNDVKEKLKTTKDPNCLNSKDKELQGLGCDDSVTPVP